MPGPRTSAAAAAATGFFLAAMAWTGALRGLPNAKSAVFRWIVEDAMVAMLGRPLATLAFVSIGLSLAYGILRPSR